MSGGEPWPPEPRAPNGMRESELFLDFYAQHPEVMRAKDVQDALTNRILREASEAQARRRQEELSALIPDPVDPEIPKPCLAVGVSVDLRGNRRFWVTVSGDGELPDEVADALHPWEDAAPRMRPGLHAEERLVAMTEWARRRQRRQKEHGIPVTEDEGIRLESVSPSYRVCWRRCQEVLRREGTKPLAALQPRRPGEEREEPMPPYGPAPPHPGTRPTLRLDERPDHGPEWRPRQ